MTESILYIATIAAVVLSLFAQIYVSSTFKRFSRKATLRGESAESVSTPLSRRLLMVISFSVIATSSSAYVI